MFTGSDSMIDRTWVTAALVDAERPRGDDGAVERLRTLLLDASDGFAAARADVASPTLSWPRRGLDADEATSFLAAVDGGHVVVDGAGYFSLPTVRPKTPAGRYALLSRSGGGTAVNLEYVIQAGTTGELVSEHGWPAAALAFERGEFDAVGYGPDDRVVLAVEAKCRATGPDSLEKLVLAWLAVDADHPPPPDNAGRKYAELVRLCEPGPVVVWLVAARVRWAFLATLRDGVVDLEPLPDPGYERVLALTSAWPGPACTGLL